MSARDAEDDSLLIDRAAAGDGDAFDVVVVRHQAAVLRFLRAVCPDPATAEDAFQETFLAAWRSAGDFRGGTSARPWLLAIARNAAVRQRRRRVGEPRDFEPLSELGRRAGWGSEPDPERLAMLRERRDLLARALEAMSMEDREILVLRELEGFSGLETSRVLGLSPAAMKSRLHRARLRFAATIKEFADGR